MARVCVIGAGAGGMAVAARLGAKGHQVTVLERGNRTGGKLHTWSRDGFSFDTGPSLFTLPSVYLDLFLKTGKPLELEVDLQETEPGFRYGFADGTTLRLPGSSVGRTAAAIGEQLGAQAEQDWRELMKRAGDIWARTRTAVLGSEITGPRQLLALAEPAALRSVAPWRSLHTMASGCVHDPRLVTLLDRYATYSGSQPDKAPGALITIPLVEQMFGLWHIGGGLGRLAAALEQRCRTVGAEIRLQTPVEAIEHDTAGVTGVRLVGGEVVGADIVVSDSDARGLHRLLDRPADRQRSPASYSGFALLLAVEGRSEDLHHHNVWFPQHYRGEFTDLAAGRPVTDPAVYVCRPQDPTMAPPGCEAWFVLVNAPRHGDGSGDTFDWRAPEVAQRYADEVLAVLADRGCDVRERIRWRVVRTPADLGAEDGTGDGAIYGTAHHGALSVLRRPRNSTGITGLYLVGGTAHPGGGLPLVGMGAEIVADRIGRADRSVPEESSGRCSR